MLPWNTPPRPASPPEHPLGRSAGSSPSSLVALLFLWCACSLPSGCFGLERKETSDGTGVIEPEVFDIVRASNSKATLDHLRRRYHQEAAQARLLENQIQNLISAQAGLANSLQAYEEDFASAEEEVAAVQTRTREMETSLTEQKALADQSAKELEEAKGTTGAAQDAVEELKRSLAALETERAALAATQAKLSQDLELLRALRLLEAGQEGGGARAALRQRLEALLEEIRALPPEALSPEALPADPSGGPAAESGVDPASDPPKDPPVENSGGGSGG